MESRPATPWEHGNLGESRAQAIVENTLRSQEDWNGLAFFFLVGLFLGFSRRLVAPPLFCLFSCWGMCVCVCVFVLNCEDVYVQCRNPFVG